MSVRKKLLLLAATPVFITGVLLLGLFLWGHERASRAHLEVMAWERHAMALRKLDWAARFYFDNVADGLVRDPLPHEAESKAALASARAESLALSTWFSAAERAADQRLEALLGAFVEEGERVGKDPDRLSSLAANYREEIRNRVDEEAAGNVRAIRAAEDLSDTVQLGGFIVAFLALFTAIGASAIAVRGFGGRVASLEEAAARVAAGHLEEDVPVTSGDELGRLAGSLNVMIEALRRQRTKQLGFLAAVAHDLRNPLAPMHLATETLLEQPTLPPEPILRKSLGLINRQIERIARMANDLLDATSIEAGELKLTPRACDLTALARDVTELYMKASPRHELRFSGPAEPVTLVCDETRIAQVLENLVSNAIKYSPAGGTVDLTITASADTVSIAVADTGPGIEPAMLEAIFEPFRRVSPSNDVVPGVGLGLSTCRRIVVAHGGRIDVTSVLGRGTSFQVHLPRQIAMATSARSAAAVPQMTS